MSYLSITCVLVAIVVMVLLRFFLYNTNYGRVTRAVASNPSTVTLFGIRPERVFGVVAMISGILAAVAAVLISTTYNQVSVDLGDTFLLKALVVVVIGGLGSIPGAVLASFLVGIVESGIVNYGNTSLQEPILFAFLICVLLVRPYGLFGSPERLRT